MMYRGDGACEGGVPPGRIGLAVSRQNHGVRSLVGTTQLISWVNKDSDWTAGVKAILSPEPATRECGASASEAAPASRDENDLPTSLRQGQRSTPLPTMSPEEKRRRANHRPKNRASTSHAGGLSRICPCETLGGRSHLLSPPAP